MEEKKQSFTSSPRYKHFVQQRDEALERIYHNSLLKTQDILNETFTHMIQMIMGASQFRRKDDGFSNSDLKTIRQLDTSLSLTIETAARKIQMIALTQRRLTYLLTLSSEGEAIARTYGEPSYIKWTPEKFEKLHKDETYSGGTFYQRALLNLSQVKNKMLHEYHRAVLSEPFDIEELKQRLVKSLPRKRRVNARRPIAKPKIVESQRPDKPIFHLSTGNITQSEWDEITKAYQEDYIMVNRSPEAVVQTIKTTSGDERDVYAWELEQEITQDFVLQVREGQVDAASQNGIVDFVWIAIVDNKTDDCCLWRDGLTTKEIEAILKTDRRDDECDSIVPPAHFNCRCRLAPASDDLPERTPSNLGDFDEWLNEKK